MVWGEHIGTDWTNDGTIFDYATGSWTPMTTTHPPAQFSVHAATWTGETVIVWGPVSSAPVSSG